MQPLARFCRKVVYCWCWYYLRWLLLNFSWFLYWFFLIFLSWFFSRFLSLLRFLYVLFYYWYLRILLISLISTYRYLCRRFAGYYWYICIRWNERTSRRGKRSPWVFIHPCVSSLAHELQYPLLPLFLPHTRYYKRSVRRVGAGPLERLTSVCHSTRYTLTS